MHRIILAIALLCGQLGIGYGQALSPMRAEIVIFGDRGAVRATLRNPYAVARRFDIQAFSLDWEQIEDVRVTRTSLSLAPGAQTSILAIIPTKDEDERTIYLCATSRAYRPTSAGIRGQVCGRYKILRRQL